MGIDLEAALDVQIGASLKVIADAEAQREERDRRLESMIPRDAQIFGSGTIAAGASSVVISCDGPSQGRAWVMRRLGASLSDPTQTAPGKAYIFAASDSEAAHLLAGSWIGVFASLPAVGFWTSRQVVIRYPLKVVVEVTGGTAGDTYSIGGYALDELANEPAAARYTL